MPLQENERTELSRILRSLISKIHRLATTEVIKVMEVDDRLRRNVVETHDLEVLRSIQPPD
ncbi:MAG: hypothetical protein IIC82_04190 [Chloroflexi bacterium]|nr:hypothetical protein [Chloroflexota bacterium]